MHANGYLTMFQEYYIGQHFLKIFRNPFAYKVVLQSMGKGPFSSYRYGTDLSPRFDTVKDLLPWIGEQQYLHINF